MSLMNQPVSSSKQLWPKLTFTKYLICARHSAKHFIYIILKFIYYVFHPFKVYNSLVFSIFTVMKPWPPSILEYLHYLPPTKNPLHINTHSPLTVTPLIRPPPPCRNTFCFNPRQWPIYFLGGFAYSEHFIYNGVLIFLYIILPTIVQGRPVFTPILQIYKGSSCLNYLSVNLNPASHLNSITLCCVPIIKNNYTKIWEREW